MWRFRGSPFYLGIQAKRLGVTQVLADRARNNPDIYRVSTLLSQLCERYHKCRFEDGKPLIGRSEILQISGTLGQCELELQKLHVLGASAQAMLADAYEAFSIPPPKRPFEILADDDSTSLITGDQTTLPLGNGTVGISHDAVDEQNRITRAVEA